jgi:cytochrome c oxidase subunit II
MIQRALRAGRPRNARLIGVAALAAAAALLVLTPAASADIFTPEDSSGSPNAEKIDLLYKITLYIAMVIFVGVEGVLIWSLVKFRHRRRGPEPAQIRGNAPLEIGWTVGAALILVVLTVITFIYLDDIQDPAPNGPGGLRAAGGVEFASVDEPAPPGGEGLNIDVNGQQYLWRFDYPSPPAPAGPAPAEGQVFTYYRMVVPVNTTVTLDITSQDVAHSWWIPELGGKADAIPGHTNHTWFRVEKPGVYGGECAELCGDNHADMRAEILALPVEEYEAWVTEQAAAIGEAQQLLAVQRRIRELRESESN